VLSHSARALSGLPESTCSYVGAFRMLQDLTERIVKFWNSSDLCPDLRETSREAETSAQLCWILQKQPKPLDSFCGILGALFSEQWLLHNHMAFSLIIFVFVTS